MNKKELTIQLINACKEGDLEKVKKLVKDGADIHYKTSYTYCTPIQMASHYGHLEIVKWLYEQGADPTTDNNYAIRIASQYGYLEVVKFLVSVGIDPTIDNNTVIIYASTGGHLEVVKYLYSIGCDPTAQNNQAINWASFYDYREVIKFLALVGCDISKIYCSSMRKEVIDYLNEYKQVFKNCLNEIYGNPRLERTRTEIDISFREYQN